MEFASETAGLFDADNINGPLDETDNRVVAPGIGADCAWDLLSEGAAIGAEANALANFRNGLRKLPDHGWITLHQMEGDPLG